MIFDGNSDDVNGNYFKFIIYYDLSVALHKSRCFSSVTSSLSICTDRKHQVCMSTTYTRVYGYYRGYHEPLRLNLLNKEVFPK